MMKFEIIHIEETDSTNRWMKENGTRNLVVVADYQTAGKGCGANTWEAERGKNLLFSVMIHPKCIQAKNQFIITQVVSVALCKTLESLLSPPLTPPTQEGNTKGENPTQEGNTKEEEPTQEGNAISIKWPNDIYVGDKKICGVLIENRLQGRMINDTIIGIGLNVNQTEFKSDAPNPVSIKQLTGKETDRDEVLNTFLNKLKETAQSTTIIADYKARLYRREGKHLFMTQNTTFKASIVDVKDDGRLMLQDEKGVAHLFRFKEVTFIIEN